MRSFTPIPSGVHPEGWVAASRHHACVKRKFHALGPPTQYLGHTPLEPLSNIFYTSHSISHLGMLYAIVMVHCAKV